jgi:hypothetical protein
VEEGKKEIDGSAGKKERKSTTKLSKPEEKTYTVKSRNTT